MLKYVDTKVVCREVPDEITLAINISGCPCNCKGCHSPYLAKDIGVILTDQMLMKLIEENQGITCVGIMGGDSDPVYVSHLAATIKDCNLKSAWYSGRDEISPYINLRNFDYIKIGHYDEEKGPLNDPNTNQKMFFIEEFIGEDGIMYKGLVNITNKFWE